jgi:hypothetical protein
MAKGNVTELGKYITPIHDLENFRFRAKNIEQPGRIPSQIAASFGTALVARLAFIEPRQHKPPCRR